MKDEKIQEKEKYNLQLKNKRKSTKIRGERNYINGTCYNNNNLVNISRSNNSV